MGQNIEEWTSKICGRLILKIWSYMFKQIILLQSTLRLSSTSFSYAIFETFVSNIKVILAKARKNFYDSLSLNYLKEKWTSKLSRF